MISPNETIANPPVFRAAAEAVRDVLTDDTATAGQPSPQEGVKTNVGSVERNLSIAAGAALGLLALSKPISLRGVVLAGIGGALIYRGVKGHCALYEALGIDTRRREEGEPSAEGSNYFNRGIHVEQSVTINKSAAELFAFWRRLENLPQIMTHLKEVRVTGEKTSRWSAKAPLGLSVEWDAEIINEEAGGLIAWRSTGETMVDNSGSVRFLPADNGATEVRVVLDYVPPAGQLGAMVAKLLGEEPAQQVEADLKRFKSRMESGESTPAM